MVPAMFAPLAERLIDVGAPEDGEHVLDLACGTGIAARRLAARYGDSIRITGLDFDARMLAVARSTAERDGLAIDWHQGGAGDLPFPDEDFDLVLCQMAIQFLPDRAQALAEARRVLKPGGRIALNAWYGLARNPFWDALNRATLEHLGGGMVAQPFSLDDPDALVRLLGDTSFEQIEVEPVTIPVRHADPEQFLASQIRGSAAVLASLRPLDVERHAELAAAIRADMAATLQAHTVDGRLEIPTHGYMLRARRPA
jgi:SAM-dependent methyltransferase